MANLNDLDDVTISNPKVGEVVKYTATGWQNAADTTGSPVGGNPCGNMDGYTRDDRNETITEMWEWKIDSDGNCGIRVENEAGVNNLDEYAEVCPGRVVVGNNLGRGELKARDLGKTRLSASDILFFQDRENPSGVTLSELVACCDQGGGSGDGGVSKIIAGNGISISPSTGTGEVTVTSLAVDPENPAIYPTRYLNFGRTSETIYTEGVIEDAQFAQQTENITNLPAAVTKYILTYEVGGEHYNIGNATADRAGRARLYWDLIVSTGTLSPNNRIGLLLNNYAVNGGGTVNRDEFVVSGRQSKSSVLDLGDDWQGGDLNITTYLGYKKVAKGKASMGHGRVILTPIPPGMSPDAEAAFIANYITVTDDENPPGYDEDITAEEIAQDLDVGNKEYLKIAILAVTGAYNFGGHDETITAQLKTAGEGLYALQTQADIDPNAVIDTINTIVDPVRQYLVFSWDYHPVDPVSSYMF